ncbi:MAG: hypothetical protein ACPGRE_08955 [Flavobacteriaceae bacterium]
MRFLSILFVILLVSCSNKKEVPIVKVQHYLSQTYVDVPKEYRKFEFYSSDLNSDGSLEYFVKLVSPYFCGTGGCSILLLDSQFKLLVKFTVSDVFYLQTEMSNGWKVILTESEGQWRKLEYPYPNNPSILPISKDRPSSNSVALKGSKVYMF